MFHRVGDIGGRSIDSGFGEGAVEQLAGGADEGFAGDVFVIAGLLADDHDAGIGGAFAEDGAGGVLPKRADAAGFGKFPEFVEGDGSGGHGVGHRTMGHFLQPSEIGKRRRGPGTAGG